MYLKSKEKKRYKSPHYIPHKQTLPLTKISISYTNSPPKTMTTLIPKTTPPFCHEWQRVSNSSSHRVVTGRASILILILIIIMVVGVTIIVLVLKCLWRKRGRRHEATKASLPSSNTVDMSVHLTQLITKCVKVSIHVLNRNDNRSGSGRVFLYPNPTHGSRFTAWTQPVY